MMTGMALLAFAINYIGTSEVRAIQERKGLKAATLTAGNVLLANTLMYVFVNDPIMAIPEMLGAFAGTYMQCKRK